MFQFPRLASPAYVFNRRSPGVCQAGLPHSGNPRISLLPAARGLSQVATSFFASRCQGIHHTPLLAWPKPYNPNGLELLVWTH